MRAILLLGLLLATGCVSDDQACQNRGLAPGTSSYDNCRSTLAQNRQQAATLMNADMASRPLPMMSAIPFASPAGGPAQVSPMVCQHDGDATYCN
jgi:hypothetical protein